MRRLLPVVVGVIVLGFVTTKASLAQGAPDVLVRYSEWEIRHGIRDERYNFQANGYYDYQHTVGENPITVESGAYTVQGDLLVLRPSGGTEKILRWRIGSDTISPQNPLLYLNYPDGREEFYYPDMTHGPQGRIIR